MKNFFGNKFFIYSFLLLYTFFIRIHSLTFEIISWDEATYILAGREILMGFLPYESFYEMKPPLLYYIYSIPLYIHSSVESVRIFGILCIFISASFVYVITKRYVDGYLSFLGSLFFISIMNYYFWLDTSSEIVCLPFILLSLIAFFKSKESNTYLFLSGLLISISTLIRLNIGYLAVFLFIYLIFKKNSFKEKVKELSLYIISGFIPIIILIILYYDKGLLNLLYTGTFEVPLAYASENTLLKGLINYLKTIVKLCYFNPLLFGPLVFLIVFSLFKKSSLSKDRIIFNIFFIALIFSTLVAGQGFSHHLVLILPFAIIYIISINFNSIMYKKLMVSLLLLTCIYSSYLSIGFNINLYKNDFNFRSNHKIREISNEIVNGEGSILALDYHLLYFYDQNLIPWKLIHTPAVVRNTTFDRLYPLVEIGYFEKNFVDKVLNKNYEYILCSTRICLEGRPNLDNDRIKEMLKKYKIVKRINNFSKWEHTKIGNLLLYKKLKKSD